MNIEWKPIPGIPGYSVSSTGIVRSERRVIIMKNGIPKTVQQKVLRQSKAGSGYLAVHLGRDKREYVHRLVALAFLGDAPHGTEVNHKDENKENNHIDNLEYLTRSENLLYGTRNERCRDASIKHSKVVIATDNGKIVAKYASLRAAERDGFIRSCITKCCKNPKLTHRGLHWNYAGTITQYARDVLAKAEELAVIA